MQCSMRLDRDRNGGNVKMKTINNYKNPYQKEPNLDIIVDQLAIRLQDIKDQEGTVGMPTCSIEQAEAVRRYYAAFPALSKGETSPLQYCLPPPSWCKKQPVKMQSPDLKDWKKKIPSKERRNSYQSQRKNKKRYNSYNRSFESKDSLPEWVTHEGIWDMEAQDPVREFIRAIALDEGYGTCENTVTDDMQDIRVLEPRIRAVPQWDDADGLDLAGQWVITDEPPPRPLSPTDEELYARFEAKFDRSIEALWARDQNTPDDDYQELPIDFAELLASPSDQLYGAPPPPPPRFTSVISPPSLSSLPSLADSVWACNAPGSPPLHDRLRPLHLASPPPRPPPPPPELESFALFEGEELYDALSTVANTFRSLTAINHSRDTSGFCEVPPRRRPPQPPAPTASQLPPPRRDIDDDSEREDLLTAARTHFRPIEREPEAEAPRYVDGDTFDIRGEPDVVEYRRDESGCSYIGDVLYMECRGAPGPLRFAVKQLDKGVQTDVPACDECASQAKKMRPAGSSTCVTCAGPAVASRSPPATDEMSRDWEELLADISAAHAHYAAAPTLESEEGCADRKRRHSAALRCARHCAHPHARFLPCHALDRPLTR